MTPQRWPKRLRKRIWRLSRIDSNLACSSRNSGIPHLSPRKADSRLGIYSSCIHWSDHHSSYSPLYGHHNSYNHLHSFRRPCTPRRRRRTSCNLPRSFSCGPGQQLPLKAVAESAALNSTSVSAVDLVGETARVLQHLVDRRYVRRKTERMMPHMAAEDPCVGRCSAWARFGWEEKWDF